MTERDTMIKEECTELITEGRFLDLTIVAIIIKRLLTPIKKWKAFKLGLIHDKGAVIRKPETTEEKNALTVLDKLILYLKGFLTRKNLILLAGFLLLKENTETKNDETIEMMESRISNSKRAISVYNDFEKNMTESFDDEDQFWDAILKSKL